MLLCILCTWLDSLMAGIDLSYVIILLSSDKIMYYTGDIWCICMQENVLQEKQLLHKNVLQQAAHGHRFPSGSAWFPPITVLSPPLYFNSEMFLSPVSNTNQMIKIYLTGINADFI